MNAREAWALNTIRNEWVKGVKTALQPNGEYVAWHDPTYTGDGDLHGYGRTAEDARDDLWQQVPV